MARNAPQSQKHPRSDFRSRGEPPADFSGCPKYWARAMAALFRDDGRTAKSFAARRRSTMMGSGTDSVIDRTPEADARGEQADSSGAGP
jgi:hypothetical protein